MVLFDPGSPSAKLINPLGKAWRDIFLNPELQVYKYKPVPPGFKVLYAIVSITGTKKAYIGKAAHHEKGAVCRILHKGGHVQGPNKGKSAIHDAIVSYGWHNFVWFMLDLVPVDTINEAEKSGN